MSDGDLEDGKFLLKAGVKTNNDLAVIKRLTAALEQQQARHLRTLTDHERLLAAKDAEIAKHEKAAGALETAFTVLHHLGEPPAAAGESSTPRST